MKLSRRNWILSSVACVGAAACESGPSDSKHAPEADGPASEKRSEAAGEGKPFVVGVSQSNLGEPYRVQMNADLEREAKKIPGLKLLWKDAQNDSLRQRAQVEELVAAGVDLLLISPKESAPLTAPVAKVHAQGIPVIVIDRRVEGEAFSAFVGPDNRKIGEAAGKWVAEALNGTGKLVELKGLMTSSPARDRHEGFWAGLDRSKHPGIEVAFEADTQWLEPNARREMESALARHPKIDLVFAHNDPGAHGAYLAAKAAGREKEMKFVGIDALPHEGVRYVREGILDVTFEYSTCAKEALELVQKIRQGQPVPKEVIVASRRFDRAHLEGVGI